MLSKGKISIHLLILITTILCSSSDSVQANQNFDQQRILQSASELDYPPFAIVQPDGTADGFSVALLKAIVEAVNLEVNISVGPWHEIKQQLAEGRLDVLPLVSYNTERDKIFDFTAPYLLMHGTIFVRKGENSIHSEADLQNKEVVVMRDDTAHEYAVSNNLSSKLILTTSFEEAFRLLSSGEHDAVFCQYLMGLQLIKNLRITNIVSIPQKNVASLKPRERKISGFEQKFCLAVPEGNKELLAYLNEGLAIVFANGTYEKLYNDWFRPILPPSPVSLSSIIKYLLLTLFPILFLMTVVGAWYLKREVARKTKKLNLEIQEHKQADEALQERTNFLDKIIESSALSMWISDEKGTAIRTNPACLEFYGAGEEEVIGKYNLFKDIVIEREGFMPVIREVFDKGKTAEIEIDYDFRKVDHVHVEGATHKIIRSVFTPVLDSAGKVTNVIVQAVDLTDITKTKDTLKETAHDLSERVKELNYLYGISKILEKENIILEEILQATVDLIPPAWQYPEDTCARLIYLQREYKTAVFLKTEWLQSQEIMVSGENVGVLEVYYIEAKPEMDEGPFLKEERCLINIITERLGHIIERLDTEEEKEKLIDKLQKSLSEIRTLRGIVPICSFCKKIRNDKGYWDQVEIYIGNRTEADFSHGVCPECAEKNYAEYLKE